jgi:quercetin dioxygenase-like cupin family protein
MKKIFKITVLCFGLFMCIRPAISQDMLQTNPKETKLLQDSLGVRMLLVSLPPGGVLNKHTHPTFMGYVVQGGTLEEYYEDGTKATMELPAGMSAKSPAMGVHWDKNIGKTTIEFILIELPK